MWKTSIIYNNCDFLIGETNTRTLEFDLIQKLKNSYLQIILVADLEWILELCYSIEYSRKRIVNTTHEALVHGVINRST